MGTRQQIGLAARWLTAGAGLAATAYAAYVATRWYRYGRLTRHVDAEDRDALLDHLMPMYEVTERHHVRIAAPAEITFAAAAEMHLEHSSIVRAIFKAREWIMRSHPGREQERPFLAQMRAIGWGVLAETPGREIVMGAVTQPWMADVVFRPLPPDEFVAFHEPDHVKIAWTLRADPLGVTESIFRTETRVVTTDSVARAKFRRYWAFASPGIVLIRWALLGPLKTEAERRVQAAAGGSLTAAPRVAR
jgi:hypothetical protein